MVAIMPTRAQASLSPDEGYTRIVSELYPDEIPQFYDFYSTLGAEDREALARVIEQLRAGEWGLFGMLLTQTDSATAEKTLAVLGSYDAAELTEVTTMLAGMEFESVQTIPVLMQAESFENARNAMLDGPTACVRPDDAVEDEAEIDGEVDPDQPAQRMCSEAEAAFLDAYFPPQVRRVTRGVRAEEGEIPWQAQLSLHGESTELYRSADEREKQKTRFGRPLDDWEINHTCGAVYLGGRFVLTAAHCIGNLADEDFFDRRRIHLGSIKIDGERNLFKISKVLIHADYIKNTLENDIALIQLERVPTGLRQLRSAKLPRSPARPSGQVPLLLSGWGYQRPASSSNAIFALDGQRQAPAAPSLLKGRVWVQPVAKCRGNIHFRRRDVDIHTGQLCVGSPRGVDSCRGDSGGPLVNPRSEVLIGLVSGGAGCGLRGTPSIFVDVGYYRNWIDRAMAAAPRLRNKRKHNFR